jgi:uncharacterized secreted protein with C-terminal beta-propeller domain
MHFLAKALIVALALYAGGSCTSPSEAAANDDGLRAFSSEAELSRFVRKMRRFEPAAGDVLYIAPPPLAAPPPPSAAADAASPAPALESLPAFEPAQTQITNVQEVGVDEGGIVKVAGEYLVVLRRGRIFTVRHGGNALEPVDAIDAFPPGDEDPDDAWYDEMLVAGDQIVVIGYSYGD